LEKRAKVAITGLVGVHLLVTLWHGYAHGRLGVTLPPEQNVFVFLVVILAPLVAGLLVWTRYLRIGASVFVLSMLGSFLFGVYHHFVAVSADHVQHLPNGSAGARAAFIISAAALAFVELGAALYGAFCLQETLT
jgi:hypothetical protein